MSIVFLEYACICELLYLALPIHRTVFYRTSRNVIYKIDIQPRSGNETKTTAEIRTKAAAIQIEGWWTGYGYAKILKNLSYILKTIFYFVGGTLKIYGEALCKDVPYKTLLLSIRDCAGSVVREMLEKYGLSRSDPSQWCLVQVTQQAGGQDVEYVLDDDECPLSILMNAPNSSKFLSFTW